MIPFGLLALAAIVVAAVALTGFRPRGTKRVANTRLMAVARMVLVLAAVAIAAGLLIRS